MMNLRMRVQKVIYKIEELDQTWNSVDIDGSEIICTGGYDVPNGISKQALIKQTGLCKKQHLMIQSMKLMKMSALCIKQFHHKLLLRRLTVGIINVFNLDYKKHLL